MAKRQEQHQSKERGSALIEFMLSSLVWLPLLLGTIVFSINLIQAIQVSELARDSAHMLAQGIDFSQSQNAAILARLANGLNIQPASSASPGNGAVLLSKITLVTQQDCKNVGPCPNLGQYVFTYLYIIGNQNYAVTKLGSPSAADFAKGTSLQPQDYLTDTNLRASNFPHLFDPPAGQQAQAGQIAYVSEVNVNSQAISWTAFSNTGSYARSIF